MEYVVLHWLQIYSIICLNSPAGFLIFRLSGSTFYLKDSLRPNIPGNRRNRKQKKRGRPRLFDVGIYAKRFCVERSFAWVDKYKRLLIRFERTDANFFGFHCIAFAMINLRHLLA